MIIQGNCIELLKALDDSSVDAVVTDPPYGLGKPPPIADVLHSWLNEQQYHAKGGGFMGKSWDAFVPGPEVWRECLRVLKPGGHLVSSFGTRTYDVGALAIRIAGFEIRDQLAWVYGSGFPKSHNISKAIDKAAGAEREVVGKSRRHGGGTSGKFAQDKWTRENAATMGMDITAPATPEAKQWDGWGTALKPAQEPIALARKPLEKGLTIAQNVQKWGTGAINVDGCRVGTDGGGTHCTNRGPDGKCLGHKNAGRSTSGEAFHGPNSSGGRWPANLVHDGSDEVLALFPDTAPGKRAKRGEGMGYHGASGKDAIGRGHNDNGGSAARFFYCAKASKKERGPDCNHPTVKPVALMRWLVRMVTPPGGTMLDPFCGSGTTGIAAKLEGMEFIGIELSEEYCELARARIAAADDGEC